MPTTSSVTDHAPKPTAPPRWRDNWGHFIIVLPLILLGSRAIHDPSFALFLIALEMYLFWKHVQTKHPEHPIFCRKPVRRIYIFLGPIMMGLSIVTSISRPIRGFNEIAASFLLMVSYFATSELVHRMNHRHEGLTELDWHALSIRDAVIIKLLLVAVPTATIAILFAKQ